MSVEFGTSGVSQARPRAWVLRSMEERDGAFHYATDGDPTTDLSAAKIFDTLELAEAERAAVTKSWNGCRLRQRAKAASFTRP